MKDYATPYQKLESLPQWADYLKDGISLERLDRLAAPRFLRFQDHPWIGKCRVESAAIAQSPPVGKGRKFQFDGRVAGMVLGGWQVAGISTFKSGYPLSISAVNNNTNSLGGLQRPNVLRDPSLENPDASRWFDTAAFVQPAPFASGNSPRTMPYLRTHGVNNFDFTLQKYWGLWWSEQSRLQFRTEFYNLFNRTTFYQPRVVFGDPTFAQIFQAMPARSIQLGLKLYW